MVVKLILARVLLKKLWVNPQAKAKIIKK